MADTKFDIKAEAVKPLYATVGAGDIAFEAAKKYVADVQAKVAEVQKKVTDFDFAPKTLQTKATTLVNGRVETITADAKSTQAKLEAKVAELRTEAQALPAKVQAKVNETVTAGNGKYAELATRGESLVVKLRKSDVVEAAEDLVDEVAEAVKPAAKKAPARKAPAKKAAKEA